MTAARDLRQQQPYTRSHRSVAAGITYFRALEQPIVASGGIPASRGPRRWRLAMPDLRLVFSQLRAILEPYASTLGTTVDTKVELSLQTAHVMKNGKPLFFGAVQIKKNYVSFHLMPVYVQPALLEGVSPALLKRMQGKSCFNFRQIDNRLFDELEALTKAGYASYKAQGFV
jgi:hypothetical protein